MKPPEPRLTRIVWGLHPDDVEEALQTLAEEHLVQMEVAHRRIDALRVEEANWALSISRLEERMAALRESLATLERGRELATSYAERQLQLVAAELAERDRLHREQLATLRTAEQGLQGAIAEERGALGALARRLAGALEAPVAVEPADVPIPVEPTELPTLADPIATARPADQRPSLAAIAAEDD